MGRPSVLATLALIGAMGLSGPAPAQVAAAPCRLCGATDIQTEDKPSIPVSLDVETSLDFDRLILAGQGDGSAALGPHGERNVSGSIAAIGARAMVGRAVIRGEPGRLVRIVLPDRIELHGLSGGMIYLDSIRSDLPPEPRLDGRGMLSFRFGGVLRISGDLDGEFRGDVPIDVDYF